MMMVEMVLEVLLMNIHWDVAHISTCDDGCLALAELLGWKAELEEMVKREHEKINSKAEEERTNQSSGAAGKADSGKAESGKAESGKAESGKAESGKAESGKAESGKAEVE
ncbi:unnamed protein product [Oncorhynchus mykiss]|uniref:Uncharacterized protein n=1 Tax=Oncorhynchus mykiss TaxID=8022 RepID=A0A060XJ73_ONCMY|nr:unnamed protein product [Oncorhynchus mykiss]